MDTETRHCLILLGLGLIPLGPSLIPLGPSLIPVMELNLGPEITFTMSLSVSKAFIIDIQDKLAVVFSSFFFSLDQHPLDSIAPFIPPSEGFPSITAFFNPEDSISLPSFPPNYSRQPVGYHGNQPHPQRGPTRTPQYQDSLSLDPFGSIDPLHDSFDEDLKHTIPQAPLAAAPSAPLEPPPPYFEPSPYFQSPLVNSTNAPLSSSTPTVPDNRVMDEEDSVNILRQRERNEM